MTRPPMPLGLSSEEAVRWQTCTSKVAYTYLAEARSAAKNHKAPGLSVYRCRYKDLPLHFHIGRHRTKR